MPAPPPEPPDSADEAALLEDPAVEVLVPESPPQAASAVAPRAATPTTPAPRITVRRSG
jgi:hypothetical protein